MKTKPQSHAVLALALAALLAGGAAAQTKTPAAGTKTPAAADPAQLTAAQKRLTQVTEAYYDVPLLYPENYICEMRSPELLNAVDPKLRQAWGQGYLVLTRSAKSLAISIEGVANTQLDLSPVATAWQQALGAQVRQFESRLPGWVAAAAYSALTEYQVAMAREGALTRIDLKAKTQADFLQTVSLWIDDANALTKYSAIDKQGGRMDVALKNLRLRSPQPKLVATSAEVYLKRAGVEEKYWIEVEYQNVFGEKAREHLLYRSLKVKRTDARGLLPNQLKPGEVNPVSFVFSNYRVGAPAAVPPKAPGGARLEDLYVTGR
jgi:hypothetical protein